MASSNALLLLSCLVLSFMVSISIGAKPSFHPKNVVLWVTKDSSTLQYVTHIAQRTPMEPVKVTLDLGGQFLWVDCEQGYNSSSYKPARCGSAQCSLAKADSCNGVNTCGLTPDNTVTRTATSGDLGEDVLDIQSTDGSNPGKIVSVPKFLFACSATFLLQGLASGAKGMAGLGRTPISIPSQLAASFSLGSKFALCLPSPEGYYGAVFFGNGPYNFFPNVDASKSLMYTPLIINPVSTASAYSLGDPSAEYFIGVKSIKINGKPVTLNTSLLSIDGQGHGGTKISTINPYTVMETSIYKAFSEAFIKQVANITTRVAPVAPFGACFSSNKVASTRTGPAVPPIDLVLQSNGVYWRIYGANSMVQVRNGVMCLGFVDGGSKSNGVYWRIYGANSMVQVRNGVMCLGFVDGGSNPRTSIVIGGYQLENNLLQFDLATSRLGFSSSLLFRRTTCSDFNATYI